MVMSFVRRAALTSLAPLLLLGACAEDKPDPPAAEPTSSPPSATTSAAEPSASAEPTLPPEAEGTGPEAAEAFVRHYLLMSNYAQTTGDASGLRLLGTKECAACERAAKTVDEIYSEGGHVAGGEATVERADVRPTRPSKQPVSFVVVTDVSTARQSIVGSETWGGDYPASTVRLRFEVVRRDEGMRIADWGQA